MNNELAIMARLWVQLILNERFTTFVPLYILSQILY